MDTLKTKTTKKVAPSKVMRNLRSFRKKVDKNIYKSDWKWTEDVLRDWKLWTMAHPVWEKIFDDKDLKHLNSKCYLIDIWWKELFLTRWARKDDLIYAKSIIDGIYKQLKDERIEFDESAYYSSIDSKLNEFWYLLDDVVQKSDLSKKNNPLTEKWNLFIYQWWEVEITSSWRRYAI